MLVDAASEAYVRARGSGKGGGNRHDHNRREEQVQPNNPLGWWADTPHRRRIRAAGQWARFCALLHAVVNNAHRYAIVHPNLLLGSAADAMYRQPTLTGRWHRMARAVMNGGWTPSDERDPDRHHWRRAKDGIALLAPSLGRTRNRRNLNALTADFPVSPEWIS